MKSWRVFFWLAGLQVKWGCFQTIKPTWGFILAESLLLFFSFSSLFCGFAGRLIFLVDTPKKAAMRRGSCASTMGSCTWKRLKRRIQLGWNAKAGEELSKTAGLVASWCHRLAPEGEVIVFQVVFQFLNRGGEQDGHYAWLPFLDATTFGSVVGWFFVRWFNGSQRIQGACY